MEFITGIVVSLVVEGVKRWFATSEYMTLLVVAILSLAGAWLYVWLTGAGYWQSILPILTTAGAFNTYLLDRFKK